MKKSRHQNGTHFENHSHTLTLETRESTTSKRYYLRSIRSKLLFINQNLAVDGRRIGGYNFTY